MESLFQDIRYGLRVLFKNPGFTVVAVLTLALGIGANTAIFSLINAVMLKMLPVTQPGQLVVVGDPTLVHNRSLGDPRVELFSYPLYRELSAGNQVFSGLLASSEVNNLPVSIEGAPDIRVTGVLVSGNYFSVLGVNSILGRTISPDDDTAANSHPVVVLSYGFWKEKFGADPNVVGRSINIRKNVFTVVGVAQPGFFGDTVGDTQDMWIPVTMQPQVITGRAWLENFTASWLHCIGRLKPGSSVASARANLNVLLQQLANGPMGAKLAKDDLDNLKKGKIQVSAGGGGFSQLRSSFYQPLMLLMFIVGMVLLIACVNVANLLLARATSRQREMAVRLAIGASPGRVVRQLLTESLLLAFTGGVLGLLIAHWGTQGLLFLSHEDKLQVSPDAGVFLFTAAVCILTGVLFGLIPALRSGRVSVAPTLKPGQNAGNTRSIWSWGKMLVASQVALSLLVLFAAGLLVRSLQNLRNLDLGYQRDGLLVISADPLGAGYSPARITDYTNEVGARLASLPGVSAVSSSANGLFSGHDSSESIHVQGYVAAKDEDRVASSDDVSPGYFKTVGIPLILGRDIGMQDTAASPKVAVINEAMAKFYFGNTDPIGKKFTVDDNDEKISKQQVEIVGVSRDARDHEIRGTVPRRYYVPISQATENPGVINFEVRSAGDTAVIEQAARKQIQAFDSRVPINRVRSLNESVDLQISNEILIAKLSSFFAGLALLLACVGLYGVMSYSVTARTREIGVRMALGAQRPAVLWLVLREALKLVAVGVIVGIPAAFLSSQLLSSMLFGLKATDATSMLVVLLVLVTVAIIAGLIPARRATRVDPMVALRYE